MSLNESIKKYSLKYVHCPHGGLHTGEVMNMVCVDSSCSSRGLICPICRMEHHENHQILPIKTFLEHIRSMFTQSDNNEELNNLSDYLRAMENSKKSIIGFLRAEVTNLANSFKSLEEKIQENYAAVRRNVLIQSSITTKLPTLLTLLSEENSNKDGDTIREQFKKYTELLKYEDNKLKVSDKAKSLVQSYSSLPTKLESLLTTYSSEFTKKLESLPKFFQEKQKVQESNQSSATKYTFSSENKFFDIILQEESKLARCSDEAEGFGFIFVKQNKGGAKQKLILQIVSSNSNQITVGMGDVDLFRNECSFMNEGIFSFKKGTMDDKKDSYSGIYSSGGLKLFSHQESEDEIDEGQYTPQFNAGDILEIEYDGTTGVLNFINKTLQWTHTVNTAFSETTKANLQFVVGLGSTDSVRILDQ